MFRRLTELFAKKPLATEQPPAPEIIDECDSRPYLPELSCYNIFPTSTYNELAAEPSFFQWKQYVCNIYHTRYVHGSQLSVSITYKNHSQQKHVKIPISTNMRRITLNRKGLLCICLNNCWYSKANMRNVDEPCIISFVIRQFYLSSIFTDYGITKNEPLEEYAYCLTGNSQIRMSYFDTIDGLASNYVTIGDNLIFATATTDGYTFCAINVFGKRIYDSRTFPGEYKQVFGCNRYVYIRYSMNDAQYVKIFDASKGFICIKTIHLSSFSKDMTILKMRYSKKSKCLGITYYMPTHTQLFIYWYDFAIKRGINTHITLNGLNYRYFTKNLNLYINNKKYLNPFNQPTISAAICDELCCVVYD